MDTRIRTFALIALSASCMAMAACKQESSVKADHTPRAHADATPIAEDHASATKSGAFMAVTSNGAFQVLFTPRPEQMPLNELFTMNVRVIDVSRNAPAVNVQLAADAAMPSHHHGMNTVPKVARNDDGSFTVRGMQLHMHGDWELYFDITRDGSTQRAIVPVTLE